MTAPLSPMAAHSSHTLTLTKLNKVYGRLHAIRDVSLSMPRGSFVTLLGPSGSGKTTILMAIAGFVQPTSGSIRIDDRDITALAPEQRNFGMMFQGYALFPHMTVAENVWFPLRVRGHSRASARERVHRALEMVQMEHLAERRPMQLSGGQQQRVALARALVFEPDLVLLDEPLSALDKNLRHDLQIELKSLHQRLGVTFVYVTHDQEEALSMSDHIVILRNGQIEQKGSPSELFERPDTRFVADFLGRSNFISGHVIARDDSGFDYVVGTHRFWQSGAPLHGGDENVLIAIRPQKVAVSANRPDATNTVEGRVKAVSYLGTSYYLLVSVPGLEPVSAVVSAWGAASVPREGASVWLSWDPASAVVVSP